MKTAAQYLIQLDPYDEDNVGLPAALRFTSLRKVGLVGLVSRM